MKIMKIMKEKQFEILIGAIVICITAIFGMFIYKVSNKNKSKNYYNLYATFENIDGINIHSKIKIGGLEIGEVSDLYINKDYKIRLTLNINNDIQLPIDSEIKVSTSGIIGSKYLKVEIGGKEEFLKDGESFEYTQSTMDLEDMISKFILNKAGNDKKK